MEKVLKPFTNNCIFSKKIPFLSIHHTVWGCPRILKETQHLTKCVISIKEPLLKLNRAFVFRVNNWLRWNLASTTGTNFPFSTSWFESRARRSWKKQTFAYARGYWSWRGGNFVTLKKIVSEFSRTYHHKCSVVLFRCL